MAIQRVMLVDDEEDIRTIGEMSLSAVGGWDVVLAGSGGDALSMSEDNPVDLIILDVMMPQMDGPETFRRLRDAESTRATPIIFMTAKVQRDEVERYRSLGAAGVISKPFDPMTLPDQIRAIIEGAA